MTKRQDDFPHPGAKAINAVKVPYTTVFLTKPQVAVFQGLADGKTRKELATLPQTTSQYCSRVRKKLGARTTMQAAMMLVQFGIVKVPVDDQ